MEAGGGVEVGGMSTARKSGREKAAQRETLRIVVSRPLNLSKSLPSIPRPEAAFKGGCVAKNTVAIRRAERAVERSSALKKGIQVVRC